MITCALLGPHPYKGPLVQCYWVFGGLTHSQILYPLKRCPKKWKEGTLSFPAMQSTGETASELHQMIKNTAGNWVGYVSNQVVSVSACYYENSISQSPDVT